MILPNKFVSIGESYIGISALILDVISSKWITVEKLWIKFCKKYKNGALRSLPTYQKYICVLEFMYMTGMINYNSKGEIICENIKSKN